MLAEISDGRMFRREAEKYASQAVERRQLEYTKKAGARRPPLEPVEAETVYEPPAFRGVVLLRAAPRV